jgi:hypothetical protein
MRDLKLLVQPRIEYTIYCSIRSILKFKLLIINCWFGTVPDHEIRNGARLVQMLRATIRRSQRQRNESSDVGPEHINWWGGLGVATLGIAQNTVTQVYY